ncbi:hypothetical protein ABPG72_007563 [Tetrahymena utriculariae]
MTKEQIEKFSQNLKVNMQYKDEPRSNIANKDGGKECTNQKMVSTIRSVGKHVLSEIGKKLLQGDLNLTRVSFPIKCSVAQSALERAGRGTCFFPIYFSKAVQSNSPIERMKLVITATIANFYVNCTFLKPLNPILGETFQGSYQDGTEVYCEQICHHPPITSFYCVGPEKGYVCYGHYVYETKAGMNSLTLKNTGSRTVIFKDGQKITYNFGEENYSGTFIGTLKLESKGTLTFVDQKNSLVGTVVIGKVKKKPTDYLEGQITQNGQIVSQISGSYMGYIQIDNERYWDYRVALPLKLHHQTNLLKSDSSNRSDLQLLSMMALVPAQKAKEEMEQAQRQDAALRKQFKTNKKCEIKKY